MRGDKGTRGVGEAVHKITISLTIELQTEQIKAHLFGLLSTATSESRKVLIPVKPINPSTTVVLDRRVTLIVDVIGQSATKLETSK